MIQFRLLLSLTKPRIFLAIGLTAWLGFFLREDFFDHPFLDSVLIFVATVLASSSGAVFNHYFERGTDALMTRTQNRPLVTAGPAVLGQALVFGLLLLAGAMLISYQAFGWGPAFWLLMGWVNYVVFYTLIFKHNSLWNVTVGSFASSFAVLAGDTAYTGEVSLKGFILAVLLFFWNPAHFWNLNVLYQDQYEAAKIPMLASKIGRERVVRIILYHLLMVVLASMALWYYGQLGMIYLVGALMTGLVYFALNYENLSKLSDKLFRRNFILSNIYLLVLYFTVVLDRIYPIHF